MRFTPCPFSLVHYMKNTVKTCIYFNQTAECSEPGRCTRRFRLIRCSCGFFLRPPGFYNISLKCGKAFLSAVQYAVRSALFSGQSWLDHSRKPEPLFHGQPAETAVLSPRIRCLSALLVFLRAFPFFQVFFHLVFLSFFQMQPLLSYLCRQTFFLLF